LERSLERERSTLTGSAIVVVSAAVILIVIVIIIEIIEIIIVGDQKVGTAACRLPHFNSLSLIYRQFSGDILRLMSQPPRGSREVAYEFPLTTINSLLQ
jgi:hypothetical protein